MMEENIGGKVRRQGGLSVGEVVKRHGVSAKTLRYYDEIGLLRPLGRNTQSGYRYYDATDIDRLLVIKYYQETGLSLEQIKHFLDSNDLAEIINCFEESVRGKDREIVRQTVSRDCLLAWQNLVVEGRGYLQQKDPFISIKEVRKMNTLSEGYPAGEYSCRSEGALRRRAMQSEQTVYGAAYGVFSSFEKRRNYLPQFSRLHMEIHPLCFKNMDYSELGGWVAVSAIHAGSIHQIGSTYQKALTWTARRGLMLRGDAVERYIIDVATTLRSEAHVTEILLPITDE